MILAIFVLRAWPTPTELAQCTSNLKFPNKAFQTCKRTNLGRFFFPVPSGAGVTSSEGNTLISRFLYVGPCGKKHTQASNSIIVKNNETYHTINNGFYDKSKLLTVFLWCWSAIWWPTVPSQYPEKSLATMTFKQRLSKQLIYESLWGKWKKTTFEYPFYFFKIIKL